MLVMPRSEVARLANSPVATARAVVDLERRNTELTWFCVGLAFVVWIMLMGRRN